MALQRRRNNQIDVWDGVTLRRVLPATASSGALTGPFLLEVTSAVGADATSGARSAGDAPLTRALRVSVTATGASEAAMALGGERAVRDLLGTDVDLTGFYALAAADPHLAPLAGRLRGLKPPRYPGLFEGLLNAVPCQQVTLTFGLQLVARLAPTGTDAGPLALPTAEGLAGAAAEELGAMGFSRAKARTLIELAGKIVSGKLDIAGVASAADAEVAQRLGGLFGVGRWTSEYVLLRALGRLGVFPHGDSGARNGLARFLGEEGKPSYAWVAERVAAWQPYAGFVYLHLLVDGATRADAAGELHALG